MFVSHEVVVGISYDLAVARLTHLMNPERLHRAAETAYEGGLQTGLRVGPLGGEVGLSKLVRLQALQPTRRESATTVSLRWEATGITGELFPALDADVVVTRRTDHTVSLRLLGSYRPPFGRAGAALDRALLGHVASATVRSFVAYLATLLADEAADQAQRHYRTAVARAVPTTDPRPA
jgi:hypothetical protein